MKVVILAGGLGTRLSEETDVRPKPMVEIGGRPILWHIMKSYASAGLKDFVICCGYRAGDIKRYFSEYQSLNSDIIVDLKTRSIEILNPVQDDWRITLVDTGLHTMTGGRLRRVAEHLGNETFCMTYGDGVADLDIKALVAFHKTHGKKATVTAVPSPGRFGILELNDHGGVDRFREKPANEMGWINGGFFVLEPSAIAYTSDDTTVWEREPLESLARDGELKAFRHTGYWKPMDTLRDKRELEDLWNTNAAPWKKW
jgi:glucose-1-phosphate cytidylyltransferase